MATNKVQDGKILRLPVGSGVDSGDPVSVGNALRGVALMDYDSSDGKASVETNGVYDLSVQAVDDAGNSTVAIGDRLYFSGSSSPYLSKKKSGKFFGIAIESVTAGQTATINVLVGSATGPDSSLFTIAAAGVFTVDDDPLDNSELIPITGALATDIALASFQVNGGATKLSIVSAVPAADPEGITVTASGTFTAGDKIQYALLRASL
jgi:predicted RecA/RadA family phage recombinase